MRASKRASERPRRQGQERIISNDGRAIQRPRTISAAARQVSNAHERDPITKCTFGMKGPKPNVFIRDKISFVGVAHLKRGGRSCSWPSPPSSALQQPWRLQQASYRRAIAWRQKHLDCLDYSRSAPSSFSLPGENNKIAQMHDMSDLTKDTTDKITIIDEIALLLSKLLSSRQALIYACICERSAL